MTESQIQASIVKVLRNEYRIPMVFHIPNELPMTGKQGMILGMQLTAIGRLPGVADLELWCPDGKTVYMEVKTPEGRQSDIQKKWQEKCEMNGREYVIVRSVKEAVDVIERHGGRRWKNSL